MKQRKTIVWIVLILILVAAAVGIGVYRKGQAKATDAVAPSASPATSSTATEAPRATAEPGSVTTSEPTAAAEPTAEPRPATGPTAEPASPDYDDPSSWAYFALGEDRGVDVFIICPTVDTRSERNSFDLNDKLKGNFVKALDMEKGIFEDAGRMYSPYYRQMSINAYRLPEADREEARAIAYTDISAAFRWYLSHENGSRPLILAGFSQGGEMCLELLKDYFGDTEEGSALRARLISVYALGWTVTEEMTNAYPQIVPAQGATDLGTVVSFDCEDGTLTDTIIIPAGVKALSINPLNWRTDGTPADRSENLGAVMATGAEPVPTLCGAYIGPRGELVVTDVTPADYPPVLDIFPEGAYHLYDYMFFFMNLKQNVADRTAAYFVQTDNN